MEIFVLYLFLCFLIGGWLRWKGRLSERFWGVLGLSILLTAAYFFLNQI